MNATENRAMIAQRARELQIRAKDLHFGTEPISLYTPYNWIALQTYSALIESSTYANTIGLDRTQPVFMDLVMRYAAAKQSQ